MLLPGLNNQVLLRRRKRFAISAIWVSTVARDASNRTSRAYALLLKDLPQTQHVDKSFDQPAQTCFDKDAP